MSPAECHRQQRLGKTDPDLSTAECSFPLHLVSTSPKPVPQFFTPRTELLTFSSNENILRHMKRQKTQTEETVPVPNEFRIRC